MPTAFDPNNMAAAFQPGYAPQMPAQFVSTNAKEIDYKSPGSAAAGYGYTPDNIYTNLTKLYNDYKVQGITSGGNKDIWKAMEKHNSKRAGEGNSQAALFNQYLTTGQIPAGLDPNYAVSMLDFGVRETGRGQQNKESFLDTGFGQILGTALQVGSSFIPVVGPYASAAIGATLGGINGGGLSGAALGGLKGYGIGAGTQALTNAVSATGGIGASLSDPGRFASNLLGLPGAPIVDHSLTTAQLAAPAGAGAGGILGTLGSVGSGIANTVGTVGTALGGAGSAVGNVLGGTGGSMGVLDSIGGFLANNAGGLLSAGVGYLGNQQAQSDYEKAAQNAFNQAQFQPYNINTPLGQASFQGNNAFGALSPQMAAIAEQQLKMANDNFAGYSAFNPQNYAQSYYDNIKALNAPEETWQDNNLLSGVYNTGGWGSTTGAKNIFSANQSRMLQDTALRQTALTAGGQESDRLFNAYMKSAQTYADTMGIPANLISQGLTGGSYRSNANANAAGYPIQAAQMQYGSDQSFWNNLGSTAGDLLQNTVNQYQNMSRQQQQYAYNPNAAFTGAFNPI